MYDLKIWARAAGIRALKTFCQTLLALISVGYATINAIDWQYVLGASALAAVISIATSVIGLPEVPKEDEPLPEPRIIEPVEGEPAIHGEHVKEDDNQEVSQ